VLISYASEDRNSAEQIHLALVGAGIQTFFDRESLAPGGDSFIRTPNSLTFSYRADTINP